MFEVAASPTELQYNYHFLSVSHTDGEDNPPTALLLQRFKTNIDELSYDGTLRKQVKAGCKRKVGYI